MGKPQCSAGRDVVKRFYSFHFGSEMSSAPEIIERRKEFLTGSLSQHLTNTADTTRDYFTAAEINPRAFRVGECEIISDDKVSLQVLLFWRNDDRSEQQEVMVETARTTDGKWLINKVSN